MISTVTLKAKKGHAFQGFYIQVRPVNQDCNKKSIGQFQVRSIRINIFR